MKRSLASSMLNGLCGILVLGLLTACFSPADTETSRTSSLESESPRATPAQAEAGLRAYRDPSTGELTAAPAGLPAQRALDPLAFSSEGLELQTLPDGTMKVDLEGRFRSGLYATRGADGAIRVQHGPLPPAQEKQPLSATASTERQEVQR